MVFAEQVFDIFPDHDFWLGLFDDSERFIEQARSCSASLIASGLFARYAEVLAWRAMDDEVTFEVFVPFSNILRLEVRAMDGVEALDGILVYLDRIHDFMLDAEVCECLAECADAGE